MVYKCNRESLKRSPPEMYWQGSKMGKLIPTRVALDKETAEQCARHYFSLDEEMKKLEAQRQVIYGEAESKRMILRKVESEGPIKSLRFHRTLEGQRPDGSIVEVRELWEWRNELDPANPEGEDAISDSIRLVSWEPGDLYRQDPQREGVVSPAEAREINRVLQRENLTIPQLEREIEILNDRADAIGVQLDGVSKRLDEPLTLKEGS